MSRRGREYVLKAVVGVWFAFAACSQKAPDVGGESHFACADDDDCGVDSVCVREQASSPRGECRPIQVAGGSGASSGNGGSGTGGADDRGTGGRGGIGAQASGPGALARAAVTLKVSPTPGKTCAHTNGQISMPMNVAGVFEALNCDPSTGCRPDEYVVEDGDRGAVVRCSVSTDGDTYDVGVTLNIDGSSTGDESLRFDANGVISKTGGTPFVVDQSNSVSGGGGADSNCTVTVDATRGRLEAGAIWASVHCENFRDPNDISETGCTLDATFLFEDCSR